jgi:putative ATP-dependent endonuclease of OLD family
LDAEITFSEKSLIIGSNDVGKTNLITGIRKLLDRSLSDLDIEPVESDFHIDPKGNIAEKFTITIEFSEISEDSVISSFPGKIDSKGTMFLRFVADRKELNYAIFAGHNIKSLEEIPSRYYLKHLCMKVVDSRRDLSKFIQAEKKHLLKVAQELRTEAEADADSLTMKDLSEKIDEINGLVEQLNYVTKATNDVNVELKSLAHHNTNYAVRLNSASVNVTQFVEKLELSGTTYGSNVSLGGDGRNNQILLALWKAKASREFDHENEVVIYCVEEPEAHLHPHQQRKLAAYLTSTLKGQTIVTSHSPQIVSGYSPDSIIRLKRDNSRTYAASKGCSNCISTAWDNMGYRMSILPAEAFFASAVLLIEGPSELLFYTELAKQLDIDLDYYNISILSVNGVDFEVYAQILDAMEIPFAVRTDNDISNLCTGGEKNPKTLRILAGLNRCLKLVGLAPVPHKDVPYDHQQCNSDGTRTEVASLTEPHGVYPAFIDLEHDLSSHLEKEFIDFKGSVVATIKYLQGSKAVRMREFLSKYKSCVKNLASTNLAKPLTYCVELAKSEAHA